MTIDPRARLLRAAIGFALVAATEPELRLLHRWLDGWVGTLAAVSLVGLLMALPDAHARASETCVKDARVALDAESLDAFGPEATVEGPKTVQEIEQESLARIAKCTHCPQKPFGYQHAEWEQFKRLVRPGDCLMFFRSNPDSWKYAFGREGYVLVREGKVVRDLLTKIQ